MAFAVSSLGELVFLGIIVGALFSVNSNSSVEANTKVLSIVTAFPGGAWCGSFFFGVVPKQRTPPNNWYPIHNSALRHSLVCFGEEET